MPCVKIGGLDELAKKVGRISPGGFPRNCSWMLAGVSQLEYMPAPPRTSQSPLPLTSQATPTRGFQTFGELLSAFSDGRATPFATCSSNEEPVPRRKLPKTVESDREYGIALIVEAQTQRQGQVAPRFPGVLDEDPPGLGSGVPVPELLLARDRVVHHPALVRGRILRELQEIVEAESRMRPRPLEGLHVVSEPALVAHLQHVRAADVRQNVAPVIVVLDEIALGKADAVSDRLPGDARCRGW